MITTERKSITGYTSYSKIYSSRWGCLECGTIYTYKLMEKAPRKCLNCEFDLFESIGIHIEDLFKFVYDREAKKLLKERNRKEKHEKA